MTLPARLHTLISTDKRFVYIGGIDYHHCIYFLLIMVVNSYKKTTILYVDKQYNISVDYIRII